MNEKKSSKYGLCPYLGQRSDPGTALSYPCVLNHCFHAKRVAAIHLGHQEEFCLTSNYPDCEEYASDPHAPLPVALHGSYGINPQKRRGKGWLVLGIVLLILVITAAWLLITRGGGFNQFQGDPTGTTESTETTTDSTPTFLSPTTTPTLAPTFADTGTFRPPLGLETPLGIDHRFEIHQVQVGDSLDLIASKHGTTVAALLACNYRLLVPLRSGWAIAIPLNFSNMQGIPAFEIYNVTKKISLVDLAKQLTVDLNEFKYYNAIDDDFSPRAGDWLLVPRPASPTPTL